MSWLINNIVIPLKRSFNAQQAERDVDLMSLALVSINEFDFIKRWEKPQEKVSPDANITDPARMEESTEGNREKRETVETAGKKTLFSVMLKSKEESDANSEVSLSQKLQRSKKELNFQR